MASSSGRTRSTGSAWGEGVVGAKDATAEQWAEATRCLREFCDAAPEVEFCLECHEGSLMEDSASALALIRGVARPNLTANLQLPLRAEPWETSVEGVKFLRMENGAAVYEVGSGSYRFESVSVPFTPAAT